MMNYNHQQPYMNFNYGHPLYQQPILGSGMQKFMDKFRSQGKRRATPYIPKC